MSIRLLLIEDDQDIAGYLVRGLREEGFVIEHAVDGVTGWHYLETREWDVILLDWNIPGPDGLSLLENYRAQGKTTPVLFLTARDAVSDRVKGLNSGADDYLCKPFAFEELLARVRAMARRKQGNTSPLLVFQDVQVDLVTQRVQRADHAIDLTAKEYMLLVYFMRHPDEVLSRTRIFEQVWEERYDGVSNTLEVHVAELRRKLEQHGSRIIHTLRNRGYSLSGKPLHGKTS